MVIFILYKILSNLYICDQLYVVPVFKLICDKNTDYYFKKFLQYFEKQYINRMHINSWNYYKDLAHVNNNSCERYNCKLNKLFRNKLKIFKLFYEFRIEEHNIVNT